MHAMLLGDEFAAVIMLGGHLVDWGVVCQGQLYEYIGVVDLLLTK